MEGVSKWLISGNFIRMTKENGAGKGLPPMENRLAPRAKDTRINLTVSRMQNVMVIRANTAEAPNN
jgi:hypothetical protein